MGKLKCEKIGGSRHVGKRGGQVLDWSRSPVLAGVLGERKAGMRAKCLTQGLTQAGVEGVGGSCG